MRIKKNFNDSGGAAVGEIEIEIGIEFNDDDGSAVRELKRDSMMVVEQLLVKLKLNPMMVGQQ